jgi:phage shock protein PspC (stress-responsive transcriptional regulator)
MISGVSAGLGHYFGIDAVWIRIVFILLVWGAGTGILAYVILWIVVPAAVTTSEKLEMTGEPVNISNIEKKVREEFENVSDKFKNVDYDKYGNQIKTGAGKLGNSFGDFIMTIFQIFTKFLGVILIMTGLLTLMALFIGMFTLGSSSFINFPWQSFIDAGNFTDYPIWVFGLLMFFAAGIPFFFLTVLGFKLLAPKMKSVGNIAKYTLLALWLISVALAISIGVKQASAFAADGRVVQKENIILQPADTLYIKFKHDDYYAKNVGDRNDFKIVQDPSGTNVIYSNDVRFRIEKTDEKLPYVQIEKEAKGKSLSEARQRAQQIKYSYKTEGNQLTFNNYLVTDLKNKFRDQEIEIILYLPKGTLLKPDDSMKNYDRTDEDYFLWNPNSSTEIYRVEDNKIRCLNCTSDEEDNDENESLGATETTKKEEKMISIKVNGKEIIRTETKELGSLSIDEKGIIIKTK